METAEGKLKIGIAYRHLMSIHCAKDEKAKFYLSTMLCSLQSCINAMRYSYLNLQIHQKDIGNMLEDSSLYTENGCVYSQADHSMGDLRMYYS